MSCTERYRANKARVFAIAGERVEGQESNFHHIIGRKEYSDRKAFWDQTAPNGHFDIDGLANIFPVSTKEHTWINERTESCQVRHSKRRRYGATHNQRQRR